MISSKSIIIKSEKLCDKATTLNTRTSLPKDGKATTGISAVAGIGNSSSNQQVPINIKTYKHLRKNILIIL